MTVPPIPSISRLQQTAQVRRINLQAAHPRDLANLYRETLLGVYNEIYRQELDELARSESFLRILGRDLREIVNGLNRLSLGSYRDLIDVSGHLEFARGELAVALSLFDDKEETDSIKRIRGRVEALIMFGQKLQKVLMYWPSAK